MAGYHVCIGEDGHSLHLAAANNDEERGGSIPRPRHDGDVLGMASSSMVPKLLFVFCLVLDSLSDKTVCFFVLLLVSLA